MPFEVPRGADRAERLSSVLEVIYLIFNEGYSATAGDDWIRPQLCEEAMRLGRILAGLAPSEPEVHGLVALMEIQASRLKARTGPDGEPILLARPESRQMGPAAHPARPRRARPCRELCARSAAPTRCRPPSPPAMPGRARPTTTDWPRIAALYDALSQRHALARHRAQPRGRASSMAYGPQAGLELVDRAGRRAGAEELSPAAERRGDFLTKLGRLDEARAEFERAAAHDPQRARARRCSSAAPRQLR